MEIWRNTIHQLRIFARGWPRNQCNTVLLIKKARLSYVHYRHVRSQGGVDPLSASDRDVVRDANDKPTKLRRDKESKCAQRAKVKHVQEVQYYSFFLSSCIHFAVKSGIPLFLNINHIVFDIKIKECT
jgi:hypothetical protein